AIESEPRAAARSRPAPSAWRHRRPAESCRAPPGRPACAGQRASAAADPGVTGPPPSSDTARELRVRGEGPLLDHDHRPWRPPCRRPHRTLDDERGVAPAGERLPQEARLAVEAVTRALARRAVQTDIGHAIEPGLPLLVEVRIVQERAAVDEIAAE